MQACIAPLLKNGQIDAAREILQWYLARPKYNEGDAFFLQRLVGINNQKGCYDYALHLRLKQRIAKDVLEGKSIPVETWKASYPLLYQDMIEKAREQLKLDRTSLPLLLILSFIRQESLFNPNAQSGANAIGLLQLMIDTALDMAVKKLHFRLPAKKDIPAWIKTPYTSCLLGIRYLQDLLRYKPFPINSIAALAAGYNSGPKGRLYFDPKNGMDLDEQIESIESPETKNYVKQVMENYWIYTLLYNAGALEKFTFDLR